MNKPCGCGCCAGVAVETPTALTNRPGLSALAYRIGTHASFLASMQARLAGYLLTDDQAGAPGQIQHLRPLQGLTTRAPADPALALLDAWATVADVLTFYQERIANEGYLRTATERRSVLELARLVGYELRPGVAASVYLAYELDKGEPVTVPAGSRAQSLPGPGELPQSFETSEDLPARAEWNVLRPSQSRPQRVSAERFAKGGTLYLKGTANNLKPNDPFLLNFGAKQELYRIVAATPDPANSRTALELRPWQSAPAAPGPAGGTKRRGLASVIRLLEKRPALPAASRLALTQKLGETFASGSDTAARVATAARPDLSPGFYAAWRSLPVTQPVAAEPYALRARAALYGSTAPQRAKIPKEGQPVEYAEWELSTARTIPLTIAAVMINQQPNAPLDKDNLGLVLQLFLGSVSSPPTDPLPLPAQDSEITRSVAVGNQTINVTFSGGEGESYTVDLLFIHYDTNIQITFNLSQGGFSITSTSNRFAEISVVGDINGLLEPSQPPDTPGLLPNATSTPPLFQITAKGVLFSPTTFPTERIDTVSLDAPYAQILPGSWVALEIPDPGTAQPRLLITTVQQVADRQRADYGISGKSTELRLAQPWLQPNSTFSVIRGTAVYAQSSLLELAEEPDTRPVEQSEIELGVLLDGLEPGRWLIVAGERTDIPGATGVFAAELVLLSGVRQGYDPNLPGDRTHSTLVLATPLSFRYKRESVAIYANVVHATHGETRGEVLGSGSAAQALQQFTLRQPPLTFVAASTPSGVQSTLKVYVNDLQWRETDSLAGAGPTDRRFISRIGDDDKPVLTFGNGQQGARLPTGQENIRAVYRSGIGKAGNVGAERITLLASRPLGVKGVRNPLPATGGADRESRDQARQNAPLGVTALDRLVSVQDYADFARTFAGIGKASAQRLSDGRREIVHLTIAGADDLPIAATSDLYKSLRQALSDYGDPLVPVRVVLRELLILVLSANIQIDPDYRWELVEPQIRAALRASFSFGRRGLGQDVLLSEVIATIQAVPGVSYVDVDSFGAIPERLPDRRAPDGRRSPTPAEVSALVQKIDAAKPAARVAARLAKREPAGVAPAQLALLLPASDETLHLRRIAP